MRTSWRDKATAAPTQPPMNAPRPPPSLPRPFIRHSLRKNYRLATRSHVNRRTIRDDIGRGGIDRFRRRRRVGKSKGNCRRVNFNRNNLPTQRTYTTIATVATATAAAAAAARGTEAAAEVDSPLPSRVWPAGRGEMKLIE